SHTTGNHSDDQFRIAHDENLLNLVAPWANIAMHGAWASLTGRPDWSGGANAIAFRMNALLQSSNFPGNRSGEN
ncbi:MAG: hypothetical protein ABWZ54_05490, partial [Luteibacter sp.]